jgi:hypothetical protein
MAWHNLNRLTSSDCKAQAHPGCIIRSLRVVLWLAAVVGGGPVARSWHPWVGLIFAASVFWTFKEWRRDMQMDESDRALTRFNLRQEEPLVGLTICDTRRVFELTCQ